MHIERDLRAGKIPGLVVLCGSESYLTDHYLNVLVEKFTDPASRALDLTDFDSGRVSTDRIREAGETISLLSERKVITVRGIIDKHGRFPKAFEQSSARMKEFLAYLGEIPEGTLLILTCDRPLTTGDYEKQSDGTRLKKLKTAVKKAYETADPIPYDPVALLGSQVVAGMNYLVLCRSNPSGAASSEYAILTVYANLQGKAETTNIANFAPEKDGSPADEVSASSQAE